MKGWKSGALYLFSFSLLGLILLSVLCLYSFWRLPGVNQLRQVSLQIPLRIFTEDGVLIGEFGEKKRTPIRLAEVPQKLIWAILDTEDQRFYEHQGVDFYSLVRAGKLFLTSGRRSQGASTITMQVARNFFLNREKTFIRKFNEMLLAIKIDRNLTKGEILELYLNKIYFGNRAYGVAAAAEVYYGKKLEELSVAEMAMIAGLPQAPSRDNPLVNPRTAKERREHVLIRMKENGHLTAREFHQAMKENITPVKKENSRVSASYVAEMVRNVLLEKFGGIIYEAGLIVKTTINTALQREANQALWEGILNYEMRHEYRGPEGKIADLSELPKQPNLKVNQVELARVEGYQGDNLLVHRSDGSLINILPSNYSWAKYVWEAGDLVRIAQLKGKWCLVQLPKLEGAIVALEPKTGAIKALCGGWSMDQVGGFNRITQAERQTGSSFKPFIYSAALEKGYTLATLVNDSPLVIPLEDKVWRPQNDSGLFYGPTSVRQAIVASRNLVSIRILQNIGINYAVRYLRNFGFNKESEVPHNLTLALGTGNITPLKLAEGYAVLANGGYKRTAYLIEEIYQHSLKDKKLIFKADPPKVKIGEQKGTRVISEANAYLINDVLRGVIDKGTGRGAKVLQRDDLAGKTGSTNDLLDAWFVGYNQDILAVVWCGYDYPQSTGEYGAKLALPIWVNFMKEALKHYPYAAWDRPETVVSAVINSKTGLAKNITSENAKLELFIEGTVPVREMTFEDKEEEIDNRELF